MLTVMLCARRLTLHRTLYLPQPHNTLVLSNIATPEVFFCGKELQGHLQTPVGSPAQRRKPFLAVTYFAKAAAMLLTCAQTKPHDPQS
jgi:hypothetical protein